jgi:hypothetical protein
MLIKVTGIDIGGGVQYHYIVYTHAGGRELFDSQISNLGFSEGL